MHTIIVLMLSMWVKISVDNILKKKKKKKKKQQKIGFDISCKLFPFGSAKACFLEKKKKISSVCHLLSLPRELNMQIKS